MAPPLVSFVTFNRLGLTVRNLNALLNTTDDFELHIVDSNSKDDTWDYIQSLNDSRIKSKVRFAVNAGPIYAVNFTLTQRKPQQYFISIDSDVHIKNSGWVASFMRVFDTFPEVGLLGVPRANPYPHYFPQHVALEINGSRYMQLLNGDVGVTLDFVPGHFQCLRPELINLLGYWSEESYYGDAEISVRVNKYTPYRAGFITEIDIDQTQSIPCHECEGQLWCKLDKEANTCFSIRNARYKNEPFASQYNWKYIEYFNELQQGKRTVYCASIHDPESIRTHKYNMAWAQENFNYYLINAN